MIRKAVIVLSMVGMLGCGSLWYLSCHWPHVPTYGERYSEGAWIIGVMSFPDYYVFDLRVTKCVRIGLGLAGGALLIVLERPLEPGGAVASREIAFGRFHLWREAVEDPVICGIHLESFHGFVPRIITEQLVDGLKVPCWAACVIFGAHPTVVLMRGPVRRWRRKRKGLCLKCGYNLTGNVSGVCPECGTEIKRP